MKQAAMPAQRIVSFLPSATEMACALGLIDRLVGVTHECDYPQEIKRKPIVVWSAIATERMSLRDIDLAVSERLRSGLSLYLVEEELLRNLAPDLILTQNLCQVCAPSGNELSQALKSLEIKPEILWMTPKSLADIDDNLRELGQATGRTEAAEALIASGRSRLERLTALTRDTITRPRTFVMEWTDPVYCSGHWIGEMVEIAGGVDLLCRRGAYSVRISWDEVIKWAPEVLVVAPCGFHLDKVLEHAQQLFRYPGWRDLPATREGHVYAVDATSYFARPGPRLIDGTELLAHLIHPELFPWQGPADAFQPLL